VGNWTELGGTGPGAALKRYLDISTDIACRLEDELIDDPSCRMTHRFHEQVGSGTGVVRLFITSLYALITMAALGTVLGLAELPYSFGGRL